MASRAALGGGATAKGSGAFAFASAFSWLALGVLIVAAFLGEASSAAFAQRSNLASESAERPGAGERESSRRFDPLRRDALGVQTRYPAVAKIVGRDDAQVREDGSQTIPLYYGTGTLVAEMGEWGIVVSNWHVVSEARDSIAVKFPTFSSPARVFLRDATWDLAALVVRKPPRVAPIPISHEVPRVGDALWVAGYGESAGLTEFQIQGGRVQNYALLVAENDKSETGEGEVDANDPDAGKLTNGVAPSAAVAELAAARPENALLYETLAVDKGVRKGDSGGPIFNRYGELAGVLWGSNGESTMGTYCIRVQYFLTQAIERLATLEAERRFDASAGDLLSWRLEDGVADAEGTELWARAALEKSGVYPISQRPIYVAADGRETPENLRRVGVEAATKRVKNALIVAENATATALPPSPPVFSPTFVKQQGLHYCARPEVAETGFWTN
ncbi:MAG: trypsin-like peptidase domain-containing protein, partial [Thermoguttaceae bacterium]|nr:trypsin-like peptidase domain-containing protein [Thermoguttaceae bacterium]